MAENENAACPAASDLIEAMEAEITSYGMTPGYNAVHEDIGTLLRSFQRLARIVEQHIATSPAHGCQSCREGADATDGAKPGEPTYEDLHGLVIDLANSPAWLYPNIAQQALRDFRARANLLLDAMPSPVTNSSAEPAPEPTVDVTVDLKDALGTLPINDVRAYTRLVPLVWEFLRLADKVRPVLNEDTPEPKPELTPAEQAERTNCVRSWVAVEPLLEPLLEKLVSKWWNRAEIQHLPELKGMINQIRRFLAGDLTL